MTDLCVHRSMLPILERHAELESSVSLAQQGLAPLQVQKYYASATTGTPPTKRKTHEHLQSKTFASLSSEMAEMKCLL